MNLIEFINLIFSFIRKYWIYSLTILIFLFFFLSKMGIPVELRYTAPYDILEFSYGSDGKFSFKGNVPVPTPIGVFTLSKSRTLEDIREEYENRILIIIKDNIAYTFKLERNFNYKLQKGEGIAIFESIYEDDRNGDIILKIFTVDPRSISPNEKTILLEETVSARKPSENELDSHPSIWNVFKIPSLDMYEPEKKSFSGSVNSKDILEWPYYWCAKDMDILSENVDNMTFRFYINDELLPDSYLYRYSKKIDGWACRYWTTILSDWKQNEIVDLEIVQTILSELNDGYKTYAPGEYRYEIIVSVN